MISTLAERVAHGRGRSLLKVGAQNRLTIGKRLDFDNSSRAVSTARLLFSQKT